MAEIQVGQVWAHKRYTETLVRVAAVVNRRLCGCKGCTPILSLTLLRMTGRDAGKTQGMQERNFLKNYEMKS